MAIQSENMSACNGWSVTVIPKEHRMVSIEGEIPYAMLLLHRAEALASLGKDISIAGFRKGHVPEKVLLEHVGEMAVLTEMAERALTRAYPHIRSEHKLDTIGHPHIAITKIAKNNPLGFSISVAVMPEVALPDYKKIARAIRTEPAEVGDHEVMSAIARIQRQKRAYERLQQKAAAEKANAVTQTPETGAPGDTEGTEEPLPELTDEYVKTLGDFASVDGFKAKLRERLIAEKAQEAAAKHRAAITDRIVDMSDIDLPRVLVDAEISQMFGQMEQDLSRAKLTLADYLAHIKKTREELAAQWTPAAEKRAKLVLILTEIAKKEQVPAPADAVEREVAHILEHYTDADKDRVSTYVASVLTNEEVLRMLERESAP